jgi:hypothetical protein
MKHNENTGGIRSTPGEGARKIMKRFVLILAVAAIAVATMALAGPAFAVSGKTDFDVKKGLAQVRQATAKYHDESTAIADGYLPTDHCIAVPGVGGMGYHYVNPALIGDPSVDPLKPEVLLYAPKKDGERELVGVEYLVFDADQDLATAGDRPNLFGEPFNGPMLGHEPGMPIHYDLHAWIFEGNPAGVFADFNPRVHC